MSSKEFDVNGTDYKIVLTEQVIGHVNNLKSLYNAAYEDPESFEDVSSEISNTINEIASTVEPEAEDSDLDGLIQEIIKAVDSKAEEIKKELEGKPAKKSKSKKQSHFDLKLRKNWWINYILNPITDIMSKSCECGICGHHSESECLQKECKCCLNFHERPGPKRK